MTELYHPETAALTEYALFQAVCIQLGHTTVSY